VGKASSAGQCAPMIEICSHRLDTKAPEFVGGRLASGGAEHAPARTKQASDPLAHIAATDDQQTRAA
jgi:hypothetical protein